MLQKIKAILCAFVFLTCATAEAADYSREIDQIEGWINATPGADEQARLKMKLKLFLLGDVANRIQVEGWDEGTHGAAVSKVRENFKKHCLVHFVKAGGVTFNVDDAVHRSFIVADSDSIREASDAGEGKGIKSHFVNAGFTAIVRDFIDRNDFAEVENIYGEKYIVLKEVREDVEAKGEAWKASARQAITWRERSDRGETAEFLRIRCERLSDNIPHNFAKTTGHNVPAREASWVAERKPKVGKGRGGGKDVGNVIFLFNAKQCAASDRYNDDFRGGTFFPVM